jgi:hypothetical protein
MRKIVAVLALPLILAAWQDPRPEVRESQPAALKSLDTLRALTNPDNAKRMGFADVAEVESMQLGTPMLDYLVWLGELRRYKPGADPNKLLHATGRVVYPVMAGGQIRLAVTMVKRGNAWDAASFGRANEMRMLARAREAAEKQANLESSATFVVRVPSLNSTFIGYRKGGTLMLVPILSDDGLRLTADRAEPAGVVFERMVPAAKAHDGAPR